MGPDMLVEVRAIYFDLDDTLCAYWDACKQGLRETFSEHRVPGFTPEQVGDAWAEVFREFCPNLRELGYYERYLTEGAHTRVEQMRRTLQHLGVQDDALAKAMSDTYVERRHAALELFPDAYGVLNVLRLRYPLGIITNGPADIQREEIELLGIAFYFQNVFIEGELGYGKPCPQVFDEAAKATGFKPSEHLFVGNSYRHDILPAIEAGWKTAWIRRSTDVPPSAGGVTSVPEDLPEGAMPPTLECETLTDLLTAFNLEDVDE